MLVGVAMLWLDVPVAQWVHTHPYPLSIKLALQIVRVPGNYLFTLFLSVGLLCLRRCRTRPALRLAIVGAIASAITGILKLCCGRIRPFHGSGAFKWKPFTIGPFDSLATQNLSFPSGDATLAFATAVVFVWIEPRLAKFGFAWAIFVGVARILQNAHYVSDVAAGALVGIVTASIAMTVSNLG